MIKIALKYNGSNPAFKNIERISSPGLRKYANKDTMPRVLNGLVSLCLSTSKELLLTKKQKKLNVGGEVLCYVY